MNHSKRREGQAGVGNRPDTEQTSACTNPCGRSKFSAGWPLSTARMNSFQIGPAPETPETLTIGVLLALPTHTPTTRFGVKPIVQLSRKSVVVPVLAAAGLSICNALWSPNSGKRALLSLRIF